jgi:hypothetical protein
MTEGTPSQEEAMAFASRVKEILDEGRTTMGDE